MRHYDDEQLNKMINHYRETMNDILNDSYRDEEQMMEYNHTEMLYGWLCELRRYREKEDRERSAQELKKNRNPYNSDLYRSIVNGSYKEMGI